MYCVGNSSIILYNQRLFDYRSSKFDIPSIFGNRHHVTYINPKRKKNFWENDWDFVKLPCRPSFSVAIKSNREDPFSFATCLYAK